MTPMYKFTFYHPSLSGGSQVVNEPAGWRTVVSKLEVHEEFLGRVEYFKGNFMWYGRARTIIDSIAEVYGPDAEVGVLIESMYIYKIWETEFTGMLKPAQMEDMAKKDKNYKMLVPIIRDDFWTRFINRLDSPVDLESTVDLDGNARTAVLKTTIPMPSQKIRSLYKGSAGGVYSVAPNSDIHDYVQFSFDGIIEIDEIEKSFSIPTEGNNDKPVWIFEPKFAGAHRFQIEVPVILENIHGVGMGGYATYVNDSTMSVVEVVLQINETEYLFNDHDWETYPGLATNSIPVEFVTLGVNVFRHDDTYTLAKADKVRAFVKVLVKNFGSDTDHIIIYSSGSYIAFSALADPGYTVMGRDRVRITVTADTEFPETETDAFLIRDAAESIVSKITGRDNVIVSDLFDIVDEGAPKWNAIMRGKHMQGNSFADLSFSMSMKEWIAGAFPLLNLGLCYDEVAGDPKIRIEDAPYFFNPTPVVNISGIDGAIKKYDLERFYKTIEVGFEKWSAESESGMDDPQTKRILNSSLVTFGADLKILCKWIAASLAIERTRRNRIELGKDDRLGEDILLVALTSLLEPEFGTSYTITNLLNSDFRINVRHTCMRILQRHANRINPGVNLTGDLYKFVKGEGNFKTTSEVISALDYEYTGDVVAEDQDHVTASNKLWVPKIYNCQFPLKRDTYKLIIANRHNALGLSRTASNFVPCHILDLEWDRHKSLAKGTFLQATETPL